MARYRILYLKEDPEGAIRKIAVETAKSRLDAKSQFLTKNPTVWSIIDVAII